LEIIARNKKLKLERERMDAENLQKSVDENTKTNKKAAIDTKNSITAINNQSQINKSESGSNPEQIRDEIDDNVLSIKNYGGEMD